MCQRTSWSLSSLTLNIVLGKASVTSPSNSIFSSLPIRTGRVAATPIAEPELRSGGAAPLSRLFTLELGFPRPICKERAHRVLQIVGREKPREHAWRDLVGALDSAVGNRLDDALGGRVSQRR